ncbi:VWA domain-containing protein [Thalassotalea nanhaiensis]|uniref:VWA domain-containing protein n=1 Tax=Thalassotalea nanhaiensis TaxID=3065648 RepID=A0ABY9TDL5_9GAMM|nr:VWA domain-containing protein [Colwelliaceae bacterium SQ345]
MIEFVYPWLFALTPLPVLIFWLAPVYKERKQSLQVPYFERLVDVTGETPQHGAVILNRKRLQGVFLLISWLCIVIAMAKPEIVGQPIIQQKSARDLMVAVDLSGSMAEQDFTNQRGQTINRLDAVKDVLFDFAKGRESDRLGLILFGNAPYLQAPFTADIHTWLDLLKESDIGMAGQSTAFGDAIGLAISVFENEQTEHRVLIVLTDGNDTGSKVPPIDAAKVAAAYNIKIYTIAVGDPEAVGEKKVDLAVLDEIANVTGGAAFEALNREELKQVYQQIDELEPQLFDSKSFRPRTSAHHYPLMVMLVLYLLAFTVVNLVFAYNNRKAKRLNETNIESSKDVL